MKWFRESGSMECDKCGKEFSDHNGVSTCDNCGATFCYSCGGDGWSCPECHFGTIHRD